MWLVQITPISGVDREACPRVLVSAEAECPHAVYYLTDHPTWGNRDRARKFSSQKAANEAAASARERYSQHHPEPGEVDWYRFRAVETQLVEGAKCR